MALCIAPTTKIKLALIAINNSAILDKFLTKFS